MSGKIPKITTTDTKPIKSAIWQGFSGFMPSVSHKDEIISGIGIIYTSGGREKTDLLKKALEITEIERPLTDPEDRFNENPMVSPTDVKGICQSPDGTIAMILPSILLNESSADDLKAIRENFIVCISEKAEKCRFKIHNTYIGSGSTLPEKYVPIDISKDNKIATITAKQAYSTSYTMFLTIYDPNTESIRDIEAETNIYIESPDRDKPYRPVVKWSPDGQKVLYCLMESNSYLPPEVRIYDCNTDKTTKVEEVYDILSARWSPDGSKVGLLVRRDVNLFRKNEITSSLIPEPALQYQMLVYEIKTGRIKVIDKNTNYTDFFWTGK